MEEFKVEDSADNSRSILVSILKQHNIVLNKSMLPKCVQSKELAWEDIKKAYMESTGKFVTVEQLKKILQNMKSAVKKKTDLTVTGNKPIKLLNWEKEFLELINSEDNPVFKKVPGAISIGTGLKDKPSLPSLSTTSTISEESQDGNFGCSKRQFVENSNEKDQKFKKKKVPGETNETAMLTTAELQRSLLLHQLKLTKIKIKREELMLKRELQNLMPANEQPIITIRNVEDEVAEFIVLQESTVEENFN